MLDSTGIDCIPGGMFSHAELANGLRHNGCAMVRLSLVSSILSTPLDVSPQILLRLPFLPGEEHLRPIQRP